MSDAPLSVSPERRIRELGIALPQPPASAGAYVSSLTHDGVMRLSGHLPIGLDGTMTRGRVGADLDAERGAEAARLAALNCLATARAELGSLDAVSAVLAVTGWINCTPEFTELPEVLNGCSGLLLELFGDAGRHTRAAVGAAALPRGVAVEVAMELVVSTERGA